MTTSTLPDRRPTAATDRPAGANGNGNPNGNGHGSARKPAPGKPVGSKLAAYLGVPALVAALGVGGYYAYAAAVSPASAVVGQGGRYAVRPIDLDVTVSKDGELRAIDNLEVASAVEGSNTITFLVPEGSAVAKGDKLVELDSSKIRENLESATLELREEQNELENARELLEIQRTTNSADLEGAEVELKLAKLALDQYRDGTYPQAQADAETALKMAVVALKNKQGDYDDTLGLLNKNFVTQAELKKREVELIEARNALAKAQRGLDVLTGYTNPHDSAEKSNAVSQAAQKLARVRRQNAANLAQKQNNVDNEEQSVLVRQRKLDHLTEQLAATVMAAPGDGLVVYQQDTRNDQNRIAEGAQVRERQVILRLPDTSRMMAAVNINEGQVGRLELGQRATVNVTGVAEPQGATVTKIAPIADSGSRWWNPDLKEYPVELTLDRTPQGAKPGVGVTATVYVDRLRDVLAVPLSAIYSAGPDAYVFAAAPAADGSGERVTPTKVTVGAMNDTMAQVTSGLSDGAEVVLLGVGEGRELLDRAGIKVAAPARRGPGERDESADAEGAKPEAASGEKASGEKASGEKASGEKASGEKASGEKAAGDNASGGERKGEKREGSAKRERPAAS